jgi:hypothetical protein
MIDWRAEFRDYIRVTFMFWTWDADEWCEFVSLLLAFGGGALWFWICFT